MTKHPARRTPGTRRKSDRSIPHSPLAIAVAGFVQSHRYVRVLAGLLLVVPGIASAACVTNGNTITCNTSPPNPYTQRLGNGPNANSGVTVTVEPNAQVAVGNSTAISLGNNAVIDIGAGGVVSNNASNADGLWRGGPNTIEFGSNGRLTVAAGASVLANGTKNNGEPVNVFGSNNVVTNYGTISSRSGAAIWFEDQQGSGGNTVDNYGIIRTQLGANANVIGNNKNGPVTFINRTGARVEGSLSFAGGDDNLTLEAGSVITGSFNGGGGTNSLTLGGAGDDSLPGDIRNFQTLTKEGIGRWTLTGAIGANGGGAPLQVSVNQGTLALTGNNANFNGSVTVNPAGTLEARAQSLPPSVLDNGLVRFVQDTAGTYAGLISGSGAVEKVLGGDLTLSGANTYSGGTSILAGTVFISTDANIGAASGALLLDGGVLGTLADLTTSRATTVGAGGGGVDTAGGTTLTHTGTIAGPGLLTKTGAGTAVFTGSNSYSGGTMVSEGVLQVSTDANLGAAAGMLVLDGGTLRTTADMATARVTRVTSSNGTLETAAGTTLGYTGTITGDGTLIKTGDGILALSTANVQAGGTAINGGVVQVSADDQLGAASAAVSFDGGTLRAANGMTIARSGTLNAGGGTIEIGGDPLADADRLVFSGLIGGAGGLTKTGSGALVLTGNNSYAGATTVSGGYLFIDGDQSAATGPVNVSGAGTRLSGNGIIGGDVNLSGGASYGPASVPNTPAQLTINGNFNIGSDAVLLYNIMDTTVGGALNDLTVVNGNLTLDGRIDVIDQGQTLGPGVYRIINYAGSLTDNGLDIGSYATIGDVPVRPLTGFSVQTAIPNQVNLINTTGLSLTYWDGSDVANENSNSIEGGNGTWRAGAGGTSDWTDPSGAVNAPWSDSQFAIFVGAPGTVATSSVDGPINASGMQFGVGGYVLQGDPISLVGSTTTPTESIIRVGDGTFAGSAMTATIDSVLAGTTTLRKTDAGTLVLGGINTYSGGTAIDGGVLQVAADANLGAAGSAVSLDGGTLRTTADIGTTRAMLLEDGGGTFDTASGTTLELASALSGVGVLRHRGAGTLTLLADSTHSGGTINFEGTLQLGNGGTTGAITGPLINQGALVVDRSNVLTLDGLILGGGSLEQAGTGTTVLTADDLYTGGTTISAGTLQLGNGGTTGSVLGGIVDNGTLVFNRSNEMTLAGIISGTGNVVQQGAGNTILTGNNSYAGTTDVLDGILFVDGDQSAATGLTSVAGFARLSGNGIVGGDVQVADEGRLAPASIPLTPATLTINGNLGLSGGSVLFYNMIDTTVGGAFNDLTVVGGNLTLDGRIDILDQGQDLGPGVYRVISYGGTLTNNGLDVGSFVSADETPTGRPLPAFTVQTVIPGQVNLVNATGVALTYWDGTNAPNVQDNLIEGGNGTWVAGPASSSDWTNIDGSLNAEWADSQFAIFIGAGGTVTSSNASGAVRAGGMQFGVDGYQLQGDVIELTGTAATPGDSTLRVGDGTTAGLGMRATISAPLSGASLLRKTDSGTLVLAGANTYTGGTVIEGGTLEVTSDANLGDTAGRLLLDGGTLRVAADATIARPVALGVLGGGIETADSTGTATTVELAGAIGGIADFGFTKSGAGTLVMTANNTYRGFTTISGGTLQLGNGGTTGGVLGFITDNAALVVNRSNAFTIFGVVSGTGTLEQAGTGTTILTGENTYTGGTTISAGTLQIGNGGTSGSVVGDIVDDGVLAINRSDTVRLPGVISGSGQLLQAGIGTTVLLADNTYTGGTTIAAGTLQLGDGGTTGSIVGDVANEGVIAFDRSDTVTYAGVISGGGALQQVGTGTTILTGANTMTGGATVAAGTLQVGDGGTTGQIFGNILDNGTVVLDRSDDLTYGSVISGTGNVIKQGAGTLVVTGENTYTGGTTISDGRIEVGDGGTTGSFVGEVVDNAELAINRSDSLLITGVISGTGSFEQMGTGTTILEADQTYTGGTTVSAGTLQVGNGGFTGSVLGDIVDNGILVFNRADTLVLPNLVSGSGELVQAGLGTLIVSGANSYSGGTAIESGVLEIASDAAMGAASGGLRIGGGTLRTTADMATARATVLAQEGGTFETVGGTTLTHTGLIDGAGGLTKTGDGRLIVSGENAYAGTTEVAAGSLWVQGDQTAAIGATTVYDTAQLGGIGTLGGDVTIQSGGTLAPGNSPGTLTVLGNLVLDPGAVLDYEFGEANVAGGALNDLTIVGGDLVLDGTINVALSAGGTFGPGVYRIFNYAGALTDNGLEIGTIPVSGAYVQVSVPNQVNLINTVGLLLNYWDGAAGGRNDGIIDGGDGTWLAAPGNDNWTTDVGTPNAPFSDGAFAIFQGAPGAVTVDDSVGAINVSGMQFAVGGYVLSGDAINLVGAPDSIIRVGDGTAAGTAMTATLNTVLSGDARLVKTDLGTLVLGGANTYSGGTLVDDGVLQIASDANLGAAIGGLALAGATLRTTATMGSARAVELGGGGGTFETLAATTLTLSGNVAGTGNLTKTGDGTLVLGGTNTYAGGTAVNAGTLQVSSDANLGSGALTLDSGTLRSTASFATARAITLAAGGGTFEPQAGTALTVQSAVTGPGALTKTGGGDLVLNAVNLYAGPTTVSAGGLAVGDAASPGASITSPVAVAAGATLGGYGTVNGDVANAGTIAVADAMERFASGGSGQFTIGGLLVNAGLANLGGAGIGNHLMVDTYVGQNGMLALNTFLGGDDSPSDQLVINGGTATGSTSISIANIGGGGSTTPGNGIEVVVAQAGATTAPGAFSLSGRAVAGPYQYELFRGGRDGAEPESWFLRSEATEPPVTPVPPVGTVPPLYRPEVPTYNITPSMALMFGQDLIGTLHERAGEQEQMIGRADEVNGARSNTGWARLMGRDIDWDAAAGGVYNEGPDFTADHYAIQTGVDLLHDASGNGLTVAGVYGAYGWGEGIASNYDDSEAGHSKFDAYSIGGYGTRFSPGGWYVDGVLQATRYETRAGSGYFEDMKTDGFGIAASIEAGKSFALGGGYSLQPQGQVVYQTIDFDDTADPAAEVRYDDVDSLAARLGLRLVRDSRSSGAGGVRPVTWWLRANVWHEFIAEPTTSFSSEDGFVPFRSNLKGTWAELGAGVSAEVARGANFFASGGYGSAFGDGLTSWNARVGLRIDW
ncbi:MAG: autotransporter-associated beta strand repeat-containing protein [Pseudoxanthomonas sp.]|nr:autotransporter-associated beta strand repeat-containing protein [Pseudoxanthomonas sp.]